MRSMKMGFWRAVALTLAMIPPASAQTAQPKPLPPGAFAKNMELIGFIDNGGHSPHKMSIQQVQGRWYMYAASMDDRGWSILDITNPAESSVLNWIPGPKNTFTKQVDIADGIMITGLERSQRNGDTDITQPWDEGVLIWSLADPVHPKLLGQYKTGGLGTHRNLYPGGRYMYLASAPRGYSGDILAIVDISDPAHPSLVSRWSPPEMKLRDPNAMNTGFPHGHGMHGPPMVAGKLAYLGFHNQLVIVDISDIRHPKEVGHLLLDFQFHILMAVRMVLPFPSRKIAVIGSITSGGCEEKNNPHVPIIFSLVDVADPAKPQILSDFPLPEVPPGAPYKNWCEKGGSAGVDDVNMLFHNPYVDHSDTILYNSHNNAGVRVYDISDARQPREIGYFVTAGPLGDDDIIVDTRGYIYKADNNAKGIWVLRYTGPKPGPAIPVH